MCGADNGDSEASQETSGSLSIPVSSMGLVSFVKEAETLLLLSISHGVEQDFSALALHWNYSGSFKNRYLGSNSRDAGLIGVGCGLGCGLGISIF